MTFDLSFPRSGSQLSHLSLQPGEMLFVLGANGSGKSSLMHRFAIQNRNNSRKISAHRQTWMSSDALDMTPSHKLQIEKHILTDEAQVHARYKDTYAAQRASMTIYELIDAENVRARKIAAAVDDDRWEDAKEEKKVESPIKVINELLRTSNIPVEISIQKNERIVARKDGGPEYSAAELSDGERNALLIAGAVLTSPPGTLLIIDEPERHLHRSIISPLLTQLFERRPDCGFIISTHDHDLPLENKAARTLLIRGCIFSGQVVQSWEADELQANSSIDDVLKRDLLGSRRKIIFIEGAESSLDKPLYSILFPMVSLIAKGSCHDVEQAVLGLRAGEHVHWLKAFGIVDGDGFDDASVRERKERGVYPVPYYSVEALYFHPKMIKEVAKRQAAVTGDNGEELAKEAIAAGVAVVGREVERLCENAVKRAVRQAVILQIPNDDVLMTESSFEIFVDGQGLKEEKTSEVRDAVSRGDWEKILKVCPVRDCSACGDIAAKLNFRKMKDYQKAVRTVLLSDGSALADIRSLFGDLFYRING